jgi:hypothetical protein
MGEELDILLQQNEKHANETGQRLDFILQQIENHSPLGHLDAILVQAEKLSANLNQNIKDSFDKLNKNVYRRPRQGKRLYRNFEKHQ